MTRAWLAVILLSVAAPAFAQQRAINAQRVPPERLRAVVTPQTPIVVAEPVEQPTDPSVYAGDVSFRPLRLDARDPYVAGRGYLKFNNRKGNTGIKGPLDFDPDVNLISLRDGSYVRVALNLASGRYLVACQVTALDDEVRFRIGDKVFQPLNESQDLLFLLEPPSAGWTGFTLLSSGGRSTFRGCDISMYDG